MSDNKNIGVLDQKYALERLQKPELIYRYKTRALFVCEAIKKHVGKDKGLNIIDFGAAEGLTIKEMDRLLPGNKLVGVEYSEDLLNLAPELPANVSMVQGDVTKLGKEIKSKKYDAISALAILEHIKEPVKVLKEANGILNPGGVFIATSPSPLWDDISTKLGLLRDEQHEIEINKKIMREMCAESGFEWIEFKRFMWAPVSFLPYLKIPVSPAFSLKTDGIMEKTGIFSWLFVNQAFIFRKPNPA